MSTNMLQNFKIILIVFIFVVLVMPLVMKIAVHVNAMDIPNARKVHKVPIPRMGGLAIFTSFLQHFFATSNLTYRQNNRLL